MDDIHFERVEQEFFFSCAGAVDVDGGPNSSLDELAVEVQFAVAGSFEFFEDHFVHAAARVDQGGPDDRQRSAFFDGSGGSEESLGRLQRGRVHTAGENLARVGRAGIIRPREAGDAVEKDHDIVPEFDHASGLFGDHFGDLDMAGGGLVERRGDHLRGGVSLHVGHFLGAFVDQEDDHMHIGMVGGNRVGHLLHQDGFARAGRGDDQHALPESNRRHQVHDSRVLLVACGFQMESPVGEGRGQVHKRDLVGQGFGGLAVDGVDAKQGEIFLGLLRRANLA